MNRISQILLLAVFQSIPLISSAQCNCPDDTEAPLIISSSGNGFVSCDVDFYDYAPVFEDNCDEDVQLDLAVDTSYFAANRQLKSASIAGPPMYEVAMSFILPGEYAQFELDFGSIQYQSDQGQATLIGHVNHIAIPNAGFDFYLELQNRKNADEWLNQGFPTSYKDDFDYVEDEYLYWDYYILSSASFLTGTGRYLGSTISLSHAPTNYYYAWQEGVKANNRNSNLGCGGWVICEGSLVFDAEPLLVDLTEFTGNFYFDFEDCINPQYNLTWTATDDCGNSTSHSHVLFTNTNPPSTQSCNCGVFGCQNEAAVNYNPYATLPNGQCYGCTGDFNGDGAINIGDLIALLTDFGCPNNCMFDLNEDGNVNTSDLILLLSLIGENCG